MPAVTGRAKTHPQFPVPAVTGRKKACEDNCLSYPPWRCFGSSIVLLLLGTNKPMRIDFLSIFLDNFRGPRKMVFRLKIMRSIRAGNHGALRAKSTNFQGLVFHSWNGKIASLALKMERKTISRFLGGLRMEDQGVQSSQTFLVRKFSFLQPPRKHDDRCTFNWVFNTDRGFKAASRTLENRNGKVQCYFEAQFNF